MLDVSSQARVHLNPETFLFSGAHHWKLFGRHWKLPQAKMNGTILALHGYSEHSGRYHELGEFLNSHFYEMIGFDLPGHGYSEGRRNNIDAFEDYVECYEAFFREVRERKCPEPYFMFAHSLGALVTLRFLQTRSESPNIKKVALSSPLLGLAGMSNLRIDFLRLITMLLPNITIPNEGKLGADALTHDKLVSAARRADPLIKSQVTLHWFREFARIRKRAFAEVQKIQMPTKIFQAGDDLVTSRKEAERFYKLLPGVKEFQVYEGYYHELMSEVKRREIMADVLAWFKL